MFASDLDRERQFAVDVAVTRYSTWDAYSQSRHLRVFFGPRELLAIKQTYDRWKENDREAFEGWPR